MAKQAPKVAAKKPAGKVLKAKSVAGKKVAASKGAAKAAAKAPAKKAPAKKAAAKKPPPRKAAVRKAAARKPAPRKAPVRKAGVRKAGVKKPVPKSSGKVTRRAAKAPATVAVTGDAPVVDVVTLSATSEAHSITTREPARNQLADDVERFLAKGGQIEEVPRNFRADPPRKPENNYGRGSI